MPKSLKPEVGLHSFWNCTLKPQSLGTSFPTLFHTPSAPHATSISSSHEMGVSASTSWWFHSTLATENTFISFCFILVAEKATATHSSTLAWKIPWMEESGRLQFMRLRRVGHDWATSLSLLLRNYNIGIKTLEIPLYQSHWLFAPVVIMIVIKWFWYWGWKSRFSILLW